ncbi:putative lectin family integral membrane protein [Patellaria atrata CBS 101060]|uniref:Lectin family integral membrane protein n=1 Tax=Patellaria atrata CBS 101060 TaxID=1346257 RepID=A0A9P4VMY4_9PEZI|nr:putative lectin family integral membrane protein [Patellaria atrata CBS 101060]
MYISSRKMRALAWSSFAVSAAHAQYVIDSISFGHKHQISPNGRAIPGWTLAGEGHHPEIMSDRVVLTPPVVGGKRGALWTDVALNHEEWDVLFEFRATGPERGSGNLQVWLVSDADRQSSVGMKSIYTIGKFDGLALVIDQYAWRGGTIRGFLNDGTVSYRDHHNVDNMAFGNCDYAYRNLGRFSRLQIKQTNNMFQVAIDDKLCFKSDKIKIPTGYYFGISAASAENPDSFEIHRFVASTTASHTREEPQHHNAGQAEHHAPDQPSKFERRTPEDEHQQQVSPHDTIPRELPDVAAGTIKSQQDQFADLHNRLQIIDRHVQHLYREIDSLNKALETSHEDIITHIIAGRHTDHTESRLQVLQNTVDNIKKDIEGKDYREHLANLHNAVREGHARLTESIPETMNHIVTTKAPKMHIFVFIVIGFQVMLLGSYIVYRRRRESSPKKYL